MLSLLLNTVVVVRAQNITDTISGRVSDAFGKPIAEVIITTENGENGSSTDVNGNYKVAIDGKSESLIFTRLHYKNKKVALEGQKQVDVTLLRDINQVEVVELGYSSQPREALAGSVATVSGEELERAPVANLTQSFPGRFAGLITQETYSELSRATTNTYVRGISSARTNGPLVIIDEIPYGYNSNQTLEYISANEIESVSVLKDASTQAIYGIQGANGVIVIKTKRGKKGKLDLKVRLDEAVQQSTTEPLMYSAGEYAALRNQAGFNDGLGEFSQYSAEAINHYQDQDMSDLYPNNNWYDRYMRKLTNMQRIGVSATGGNDKIQYYSNVNFMRQGGFFKTDQDQYNPNPYDIWINYRSNVDMNLNRYLKAYVRLSGNIKREHTPGESNANIYGSIFQLPPTMYGPLTPEALDPETGQPLPGSGQVITTERVTSPTYGMLNRSGYVNHTVTNISSQFGLNLDMNFLTKGLRMDGVFAYQTNSVGSLSTLQKYERWVRSSDATQLLFNKKGSENNTPLEYTKGSSFYYNLTYKGTMTYQRDFGLHHIGGLGYALYQDLTKADNSSPGLLPYKRLSSGLEGTYDYDNRYFVKADVGYSGSEQYSPQNRYTWTPAAAVAWAISNESFMSNVDWVSNLKVRASWGKTANDQSGLPRFSYLDNVRLAGGGPISYLQWQIQENLVGDPALAAEISTKTNLGLDLGLFNAFTLTVDVFKEKMDNMVVGAVANVPLYQGIPLENYPHKNAGQFENKGYEVSAAYSKSINQDLSVSVGAMFSYAKNKIISWNEAKRTADYAYRNWEEGYSYGQEFGYLVDYSNGNGFFNTTDELNNSALDYSFGNPRLGDLKYQDLNGDGKLDERDMAPLGTGTMPRFTYSFSGGVTYKAFDLNILFQGLGGYKTEVSGLGIDETEYDGIFGAIHQHAWTPERYENGDEISYPALSLSKSVNHISSNFLLYNRSYLRLKNIEIGYTFNQRISKSIGAEKIRILFSGQNLITWSQMKTDDFGPEGGGYASFPVYRVYNLGLSVTF